MDDNSNERNGLTTGQDIDRPAKILTDSVDIAPRRVGRPCLLVSEPEKAARVVELLRQGNYLNVSCKAAGLSYEAVNDWLRRAEDDAPDGPFAQFRQAMDAAEAEAEINAVRGVLAGGEKDAKHYMAWLGRRHSERWAERSRGGESGHSAVTIIVGVTPSTEQLSPQTIEAKWVSVPQLED